jgi:hypothetical protein
VRRAFQVLGIALMAVALLLDASARSRDRRAAARASGEHRTNRLLLPLFWAGAVLLVVSSI